MNVLQKGLLYETLDLEPLASSHTTMDTPKLPTEMLDCIADLEPLASPHTTMDKPILKPEILDRIASEIV